LQQRFEAKRIQRHEETATSSRVPERANPTQREPGQTVQAPIASSENMDMYKELTVVRKIIADLNGAVSERDKIFAVTTSSIVF
jgi:hypothetical protein